MNSNRDPLEGIEDVPWDRIVHWYGRASNVPQAIRSLGGPQREEAITYLRNNLEHQDGVMQATPFAVRFILRMCDKDAEGVRQIIEPIAAAAKFTLSSPSHINIKPLTDWKSLLSEQRLWPEYVSEDDDEMLWEEWDPQRDEWIGWAALTLQEIEASSNEMSGSKV